MINELLEKIEILEKEVKELRNQLEVGEEQYNELVEKAEELKALCDSNDLTTDLKKHSTITFKGLEWIVLDVIGDKARLLLKDVLDEERLKKYSDDEWYINGCYVAHSDCSRGPFDWNKSYIRNTILPNFLNDLEVEGSINLLSKYEVEVLPDEVKKCNENYWTKTNASNENDRYAHAWYVDFYGYLYYENVDSSSFGVRPVITISKSNIFLG